MDENDRSVENKCSDSGGLAEDEMKVSWPGPRYHGDFGGATSYQMQNLPPRTLSQESSVMAFQELKIRASGSMSSGDESYTNQELRGPFNAPCMNLEEAEEFLQNEFVDQQQQQQLGTGQMMMADTESSPAYGLGGSLRTFSPLMMPGNQASPSSWHQPVPDDHHVYPQIGTQHPRASNVPHRMFAPPMAAPQMQMQNTMMPARGSADFANYENRMGATMRGASQYYNQPIGDPSSNFFMDLQHQTNGTAHRHFNASVSGHEYMDRGVGYSPGSLSIMASSLNPPDHMLHMYSSNSANR